jgi:argininosuccinate lyase
VVEARAADSSASLGDAVAAATAGLPGGSIRYSEAALEEILSPRHFVAIRRTPGGPAPEVTASAIDAARAVVEADRTWLGRERDALAAASAELDRRSAAL